MAITPRWTWLLVSCALGALTACASQNPADPTPISTQFQEKLPIAITDGAIEWPAMTASLRIDPGAEAASLIAGAPRTAAGNDTLAYLALNNFLGTDELAITSVGREAEALVLTIRVTHPFAAPQLSQPGSGKNRADLGFAGRLVVLADVPDDERTASRFFDDSIRANVSLVPDAAGYVEPRGLLPTTTFANTFPYLLLVDEAANNRIGVSNGSNPRGTYQSAVGGWQRLNLGSPATNWTGFGYLHAGQLATITLRLDLDALGAGPVDLPLALLAKHVQPTGGTEPWNNRLPAAIVNTDTFAYRMPFGAQDCEKISLAAMPQLPGERSGAMANIQLLIRDWDARAATSALTDLSREPDITKVPAGTSGIPRVLIDAPGITAGGPVDLSLAPISGPQATGLPGSELPFYGTLTAGTALAPGDYIALAQVLDAETLRLSRPWEVLLTPDLIPLTEPASRPAPITYQRIPITVTAPTAAPACPECHASTLDYRAIAPPSVNFTSFSDDSPQVSLRFRLEGRESLVSSEVLITPAQLATELALSPWTDSRLTTVLPTLSQPGAYQLYADVDDFDQVVHLGPWPLRVLAEDECPVAPFGGNPIPQPPVWKYRHEFGAFIGTWNEAPTVSPVLAMTGQRSQSGWFITQAPDNALWRLSPSTGAAEALTAPGYPESSWAGRALLLEIDSRDRVFWVASNIDQSIEPDPSLSTIYSHAGDAIHVIAPGSAPATGDSGLILVGRPVVAMCIDEADGVWVVDNTNQLRHFVPISGYDYQEVMGGGISLGGSTAGGIIGEAVYDIDVDFHNHAFFLPVRTPDEHLNLWRIECDGTLSSGSGQPNPLEDLAEGTITDAAITIDNYGSFGQILAGPQDAQMLVTIEDGTGSLAIVTSDLSRTAFIDGFRGSSRLAMDYRNDLAWTLPDQAGPHAADQFEVWSLPVGWR